MFSNGSNNKEQLICGPESFCCLRGCQCYVSCGLQRIDEHSAESSVSAASARLALDDYLLLQQLSFPRWLLHKWHWFPQSRRSNRQFFCTGDKELLRFNKLIVKVRSTLTDVRKAVKGSLAETEWPQKWKATSFHWGKRRSLLKERQTTNMQLGAHVKENIAFTMVPGHLCWTRNLHVHSQWCSLAQNLLVGNSSPAFCGVDETLCKDLWWWARNLKR